MIYLQCATTMKKAISLSSKMPHGPNSDCAHCVAVKLFADKHIKVFFHCNVCQGWGWVIGCPGCGRLWGRFNPIKERSKK